jgi:hypothetical protein
MKARSTKTTAFNIASYVRPVDPQHSSDNRNESHYFKAPDRGSDNDVHKTVIDFLDRNRDVVDGPHIRDPRTNSRVQSCR